MDLSERLEGLALMVENAKKLDRQTFGVEPVSGFIDALAKDLRNIAEEVLQDED